MYKRQIQGYCEKSDKFDQLLLLIESALKSVNQMKIISKMNDNLKNSYMDSIEILRHTVEAKDPYTKGHSDRVSQYAVLLGKKLNLPEEDIEKLKIGGLFHDIGKIGIPDSILPVSYTHISLVVPDVNNIIYISLLSMFTLLYFFLFDFNIFLPLSIKSLNCTTFSSFLPSMQILYFMFNPSFIALSMASVYFLSLILI